MPSGQIFEIRQEFISETTRADLPASFGKQRVRGEDRNT
jgi:hypothetical protein